MKFIDYIDTLMVSRIFITAQICVAMAYLPIYKIFPKAYMKKMALGSLLEGMGFLMMGFNSLLPYSIALAIGNFSAQLGFFILIDGMVGMVQKKISKKFIWVLYIVFGIVWLYLTYIINSVNGRVILYSFVQLVVSIYLIFFFLKALSGDLKTGIKFYEPITLIVIIIIIMSIGYSVLNLWRIYYSLNFDRLLPLVDRAASDKWILLYMIFAVILRAIIVFMYHIHELWQHKSFEG